MWTFGRRAQEGVVPKKCEASVQLRSKFKSEINDAFPCKLYRKQHLEFCTEHHRSRMLQVRVLPGAPTYPILLMPKG